jgi:hypothetical protein
MKKTFVLVISMLGLIAALTGCASTEQGPSGTAAEIAEKVFAQAETDPFGPAAEITPDENMEWLLGSTEYPEFADSVAVMPMMNLDTRALHVIKAANSDEVEDIMAALTTNIDPLRLICVQFSMEDVVIDSRGDIVFVTINTDPDQRAALAEAFQTIS